MTRRKTKPVPPVCKVDGCTAGKTYTRGLCALHWCTRGDLADPVPRMGDVGVTSEHPQRRRDGCSVELGEQLMQMHQLIGRGAAERSPDHMGQGIA